MRLLYVSPALTALTLTVAAVVAQSQDRPRSPTPPVRPGVTAPGAREHNGGGAAPNPAQGMPGQNQSAANAADQTFLAQAARCGAAQAELARLAEQRAGSSPVREFARRMISDHEQSNRTLHSLAENEAAPNLEHDPDFRQTRDALSRLSGAEFDIEYLRHQVTAHQRMATLMEYVIGSGADPQVKRFASGALPGTFTHLAMARQLLDQASTQNPQVAGAPPRKASGMPTPQTPRASGN